MQVSSKVVDFVEICSKLDSDSIYTLFEKLLDEDVRDEIYDIASKEAPESPELARAAFNALGKHFKVESLIRY